ncbi:unnamed protein product [Phytophthora fragariaefolia]|uniref:Unnamed protein product n=1 Tax=Phytophthora fragariaefolia TaxID=1490495 RepID=A0A9W6XKM7_9STRA|nr:unnamed protein product [Phytophthora fragariaefolia]
MLVVATQLHARISDTISISRGSKPSIVFSHVTREFTADARAGMGLESSSSAADCAGCSAPPATPPPYSDSSLHAASPSANGSGSGSSVSDTVEVQVSPNSTELQRASHSSSGFAGSGSTLLQLVSVGDASSSDDSASCSDDAVEIEPVTPQPTDWTSSDRCRYYPPRSDGCTEPRSCRDCLNIDVGDDYTCMVNQYGRCVQKNPANYVKELDFRNQEPSNGGKQCADQKVQFPADAVDYCPYGDKKCKKCKDSVFEDVMEGRINGSLTKFCYGEEGCVCVAVCEAPIWKSTVGLTVCNGTPVNKDFDSQHANNGDGDGDGGHGQPLANLLLEIVGAIAAVAVVVAAVHFARKRRRINNEAPAGSSSSGSASGQAGSTQEGGDASNADVPMAVPVAPQLSLFGWQAMRSELIEREQLLLAGVEDFSNVRSGYLQLLDVDASAPPPEEDESSAPVLLVPLAGASAPSFSPRGAAAFASAPSAPPVSPSAPPASPTAWATPLEEELL